MVARVRAPHGFAIYISGDYISGDYYCCCGCVSLLPSYFLPRCLLQCACVVTIFFSVGGT